MVARIVGRRLYLPIVVALWAVALAPALTECRAPGGALADQIENDMTP